MNNHEVIRNAIINKQMIEFEYDGLHRISEPHVFGIKNKEYHLLVFQTEGQSRSGIIPNWRDLFVNKMSHLNILDSHFAGKRPTQSGMHSNFDTIIELVK
jgi:hypothetical protein